MKSRLIGKDPEAGKDRRQEKQTTEDKMVGWYHQLNGHAFEQTLVMVKDREACCAAANGIAKSWTRLSHRTRMTPISARNVLSRRTNSA